MRLEQERAQTSFLEKIRSLQEKINEFSQVFPLTQELNQFFSEISQNPPILNPDFVQHIVDVFYSQAENYSNSANGIQFFYLILQIIEILLNFQDENEEHIAQSVVFILGSNEFYSKINFLFDIQSTEIQRTIAYIYHDTLFEIDSSPQSKQIFIDILETFFQRSYIWASYQDEELRSTCLDFHLLIYKLFDSSTAIDEFNILSSENLSKLNELYLLLLQTGTPHIIKIVLKCLSYLIKCTKAITIDPQEMIPFVVSLLHESNGEFDYQILEYLFYLIVLITDTQYYEDNPLFPYHFFDFPDLYNRLLTSDESTKIFIAVILNNLAQLGPEAATILIQPEFFACAATIFQNASYSTLLIFTGIFKNLFLTVTSEQAMMIFRSGIIAPMLQFFSNSMQSNVIICMKSLCRAAEKCFEAFGDQAKQVLREAFAGVSISSMEEFLQNKETQELVENLLNFLDIGL